VTLSGVISEVSEIYKQVQVHIDYKCAKGNLSP